LNALRNAVTSVKILTAMGEGAQAMELLNEERKGDESVMNEQFQYLKDMENLVHLQQDGSWGVDQKFADAVNCSLANMQTTIPDSISSLKEKERIWATVIGMSFMLSRV